MPQTTSATALRWDLFCRVIDNHGDIGVCWRLAAELASRGQRVRLFVDDASALAWMAPQGRAGVEVLAWDAALQVPDCGDVVIEAFGCELPDAFVARIAQRTRDAGRQPAWLNLEYLSAESYVERSHGLPSPVSAGPGAGLVKRFFYPGFSDRTGGLLREEGLQAQQAAFDRDAWLRERLGIERRDGERLVSLFCYEPAALPQLLAQLEAGPAPTRLLVTAGRATAAVQRQIGLQPAPVLRGLLSISYLPLLAQPDFDRLLWACDFNFVRGEDSLVRAIWAGRPFCWQLYPQDDGAHLAKLEAFLRWLQPADELALLYRSWNGAAPGALPALRPADWAAHAAAVRERALSLPELAAGLLRQATAGW